MNPRALLAVAAVVALPAVAALRGATHPRPVVLGLGPGDAPYITGFAPEYEIDDGVATHWTTYHAGVSLPLELRGAPARVSYRFARVFGETAQVEVAAGLQTLDHFSARGGRWVERVAAVDAPPGPLALWIVSDSHERQDRGLKLDWVRFEPGGGRLLLRGPARWIPALLVAIVILLFRLLGWSPTRAALLALPLSLALVFGLLVDPWLVHQVLRGVPLALAVFGLAGVFVGRVLRARGRVGEETLRWLGALAVAAFLLRAAAIGHPRFYYPDQRTHARLVEQLQKDGLRFFASPARSIAAHGVWRTFAYGRVHAFPYTPAFHLPFAALRLPYDTLLVAMKLAAAAASVVPLLIVWAMARRLRAPPILPALLMVLVPTYTSRLTFAFLPALFGHALDMAFLYWLLGKLDHLRHGRTWLAGAAWVTACQLAYVSGVINIPTLLVSLSLLWLVRGTPPRVRTVAVILGMGLLGSAVSVLLYYRDFLGMALDVTQRAASGGPASHYPVEAWWTVAYGRTRDFFGAVYPVLTLAGLVLLRRAKGALLLVAWALAYALLLLGRARMPDVFLHGHETLFLTPLVCLASGRAIAALAEGPRWRSVAAVLLVMGLAVQGFRDQWAALAAQLANAR